MNRGIRLGEFPACRAATERSDRMPLGTRLRQMFGLPSDEPRERGDEQVILKNFLHRYEAEVAQTVLDAHDIPSHIMAEDVGGMNPLLLVGSGGIRLYVRRDHAEKALRLLEGKSPPNNWSLDAPSDE
jgi:hypothetical protein